MSGARLLRSLSCLALLAAACTTGNSTATSAPAASATVTAPAATSGTPSSVSSTLPPFATTLPAGGIQTHPLGAMTGQWAFVLAHARPTSVSSATPDEVVELWAIPLEGGDPRLAAGFVSTHRGGNSDTNYLGRQFAPDGRRLVLSVTTLRPGGGSRSSLVLLELETGRVRMLGSDDGDSDTTPAWSPDGTRIAYRRVPDKPQGFAFDDGIWVMNADGTSPRRVVPGAQGVAAMPYGWTPDSLGVAFSYVFEDATFTVVDVASGSRTKLGEYVTDLHAHSWRRSGPALAGAFKSTPRQAAPYILVTAPASAERRLVSESDVDVQLDNVRWHPSRDEVLYRRSAGGRSGLYTVALAGSPQKIVTAASPLRAEWWPAGTDLAYFSADQQFAFDGVELRSSRSDGSNERVLFQRSGATLVDLATRRVG
ncbi:MAG TPA: hypothetical protein VGK15_06865 [Candidatus Limnocylindria bacterium]|jgi:dipeptidyl aminopeptidase/acylaminoacyl peptidase